ncbi:MAG: 2,3-dihydroxybiphenyl 1,2-dioxygenase [Sandaracinaceae bacterium]|nr:hypothetical protein [Myxococcales bacterium]MCB9660615.1 2,3-dihydroxybiphenyl 1,2-dioxygenase [Sandaracinaceae bacterium]
MSLNDSVPPPAAQDARPSTPPPGGSAASPGTAEDIFARGRARLPLVKVVGVSHIVLERPLLDDMRHFLLDFGLRRSAQDRHGDYFRGSSGAHHLVAVRRAPTPRFAGVAFVAAERSDLDVLTRVAGASGVEPTDEAGGGERVRLRSPSGLEVQVVHGVRELAPLQTRAALSTNRVRQRHRVNSPQRRDRGPAQVERLAAVSWQTPDVEHDAGWFMQTFGLIASDYLVLGERTKQAMGAFLRVDLGRTPVDHHAVALFAGPRGRLLSASFEVLDFDDIAVGGEHLYATGAKHVWGPGRHEAGSALFDYWRDPHGDVLGHVSDGDLFNAEIVPREVRLSRSALQQWGRPLPPDFFDAQQESGPLRQLGGLITNDHAARRWARFARALR